MADFTATKVFENDLRTRNVKNVSQAWKINKGKVSSALAIRERKRTGIFPFSDLVQNANKFHVNDGTFYVSISYPDLLSLPNSEKIWIQDYSLGKRALPSRGFNSGLEKLINY